MNVMFEVRGLMFEGGRRYTQIRRINAEGFNGSTDFTD